jgi:hypothetical protein
MGQARTNGIASVSEIQRMTKAELVLRWKELFGIAAPIPFRRDLLVRFVAYKLQERIHGGLTRRTEARLLKLAQRVAKDSDADIVGAPRLKPGTCLVRDWRGQSHRVIVLSRGYEYAGSSYASLSQIARLITGTRWSGPLFFGLKRNGKKDH